MTDAGESFPGSNLPTEVSHVGQQPVRGGTRSPVPPGHPQDAVGKIVQPDTDKIVDQTSTSRWVAGISFFVVGFAIVLGALYSAYLNVGEIQTLKATEPQATYEAIAATVRDDEVTLACREAVPPLSADADHPANNEGGELAHVNEHILLAKLIGHSVITLALVFFGYSLIRAGERMHVPRWLLRDARDVEVIRAILGFDTPLSTAVKLTERLGGAIAKTAEPVVKIVTSGRGGGPES